jgi:hypothetical protein
MAKKTLLELLNREGDGPGEVPSDVPHWIVEMQAEFDERDLTPLQAVKKAMQELKDGHRWTVFHVRSKLMWSVDLGQNEVIEVVMKGVSDDAK